MDEDEYIEAFGRVCDIIERSRQQWPLDPDVGNPWSHTSSEARAAALRIFELLGIECDWRLPDPLPPGVTPPT